MYIYKDSEQLKDILSSLKNFKSHIKLEKPDIYNYFHPFSTYNPRLLIVKENKMLLNKAYEPDSLVNLVLDLMKFQELEKNN